MKPDIRIVSYAQAEEEDFAEWLAKTPDLRELVYDLNHEDRKRFQHIVHIVKLGDGQ